MKKALGVIVIVWFAGLFINGVITGIRHLPIDPCDPYWWSSNNDVPAECFMRPPTPRN